MGFGGVVFLFLMFIVAIFIWAGVSTLNEQDEINAMSPGDRSNYLYGHVNAHLICPHCQTKGFVHVKNVTRATTSTGNVGGILKANTTSTATSVVTQHHCEQCSSTWDI